MSLQRHVATRYVLPLREGGSLPAIVDTACGEQFVVKFLGAGQGPRALVAEALAALLGQALGLPVPQPAVVSLAPGFGAGEPDPEIQDLLRASAGKNFALAYLPGALGFDLAADRDRIDAEFAASVVWFDALISNVDRSVRNPNLLVWHDAVWLIDHGACFYFHHMLGDWTARAADRFPLIERHILLPLAGDLWEAAARLRPLLTAEVLQAAVDELPDEWLGEGALAQKQAYLDYLLARLSDPRPWLEEAEHARARS